MGKRSNFKRVERDFYPTPYAAVMPLVPYLPNGALDKFMGDVNLNPGSVNYAQSFKYAEPCAGDGALMRHLRIHGGFCTYASDIKPESHGIKTANALDIEIKDLNGADYIITNPPRSRDNKSDYILHRMIDHFRNLAPTWLLFDADWMHTKQSAPFMPYCHKIVSVGRMKWIPDSKMTGKDNCAWYLFDNFKDRTEFIGR